MKNARISLLLSISFFCSIFIHNISAQSTVIPDPAFEAALISLGYDVGEPDGFIPTANINTVTELHLAGLTLEYYISDLTGIEDFTALEILDCQQNELTSLDLSQNLALVELSCPGNQLTSLDLSQNLALENIHCDGNPLNNLDLSQNTALSSLSCSSCQLTSLDLSQNTLLTELYIDHNELSSIDLSQNTLLERLLCGNNSLNNLDLSANVALKYFYCYGNGLTGLDLSQNANLRDLYCYNNSITSLDLSQNLLLQKLVCNINQITILDLSYNTILNRLKADDNLLYCINLKNGNNSFLSNTSFSTTNNPNLACIEVDDPSWSAANWTTIDNTTSFSNNCDNICSTNTKSIAFPELSLYPNPTQGDIQIHLGEIKKGINFSLINTLGQEIFQENFESVEYFNFSINQPNSIYFLIIEDNSGQSRTIKILKN